MEEVKIRVNKYPYLLWLNYSTKLLIDFKNHYAVSDIAESEIEKVSLWKILLLKYGLFLFLVFWLFTYPKNLTELLIIGISIGTIIISYLVLKFYTNFFIKYLILITVGAFLLFYNNLELGVYMETFVMYSCELIIMSVLIRDILQKKYKDYYYLKDVKKRSKINVTKKHNRPLIPLTPKVDFLGWQGRGLLKVQRGFNLGFDFSLGGYYFRIENEK